MRGEGPGTFPSPHCGRGGSGVIIRHLVDLASTGFPRPEIAQGLAEYALLLLLVAMVAVGALTTLGGALSTAVATVVAAFPP